MVLCVLLIWEFALICDITFLNLSYFVGFYLTDFFLWILFKSIFFHRFYKFPFLIHMCIFSMLISPKWFFFVFFTLELLFLVIRPFCQSILILCVHSTLVLINRNLNFQLDYSPYFLSQLQTSSFYIMVSLRLKCLLSCPTSSKKLFLFF